jgi:hypothetical protein
MLSGSPDVDAKNIRERKAQCVAAGITRPECRADRVDATETEVQARGPPA